MRYADPLTAKKALVNDLDPNPFLSMHAIMTRKAINYTAEINHHGSEMERELVDRIITFIFEMTGLQLKSYTLYRMLLLYPYEACGIDEHFDVDASDAILDMVSHYYLNSWWPAPGDGVTEDEWRDALAIAYTFFKKSGPQTYYF